MNLKSDVGLAFATDLVRASDVLHENFGVGVLEASAPLARQRCNS